MQITPSDHGSVIIVDDDPDQCVLLQRWVEAEGLTVETFATAEECVAALTRTIPDAVCLDLNLPGISGLEALDRIRAHHPLLAVVMFTANPDIEPVVSAMRLGAYDYLRKPLDRHKLLTVVRNAVQQSRMAVRLAQLEHEVRGWSYGGMLGDSPRMRDLYRQLDRVAPTDVSVLVYGESGTGKELVARAIHEQSGRRDGPFVAVNCAAIPESLQESELFGHERGAFTGASSRRVGRFEQANGGTLFLDEIGELSSSLQAKLLRALQERSFHRVGGTTEIRSDFRLIAATHRNLQDQVANGSFREDLYFRMAVYELDVPPIRDRGGDILLLAETFARRYGEEHRGAAFTLTADALDALMRYPWPGNVRELQNAIQRSVISAKGNRITVANLPSRVRRPSPASPGPELVSTEVAPPSAPTDPRSAPSTLADTERSAIDAALRDAGGNASEAARRLGIGRATLYRKMKRFGMR